MAREKRKGKHWLTVSEVKNARQPGRLADGNGLYLLVTARPDAAGGVVVRRSWALLYTGPDGKRHEAGLGSADKVSLKAAREAAEKAHALLSEGKDPLKAREDERAEAIKRDARSVTLKDAALRFIDSQTPGWKNPKHAKLWRSTLDKYIFPELGGMLVEAVTLQDVLRVIEPVWRTKPETASRVRGRLESVLDWAGVVGLRDRNTVNPAAWRGGLEKALPPRSKVRPVKHHPALAYADAPAFMVELRAIEAAGAYALSLTILCATRTMETLAAEWSEINTKQAVWTIPPQRTKSNREHRVALSRQALAVLDRARVLSGGKGFIFPGQGTKSRHLSGMTMLKTLERMKRDTVTVHGFRASFRTWARECTDAPHEVCEAALGHVIQSKTVAAYARGDLLERRRSLMQAWADFLDRSAAGVVVDLVEANARASDGGK